MEVAFFDFCNTLVNINTLSSFVDFVINDQRTKQPTMRRWFFKHRRLLSKLHISSTRQIEIKCLMGLEKDFLTSLGKDFYEKVIKKNFNQYFVEKIHHFKQQGFQVVIVSGALDVYLAYVPELLPVDCVISTALEFDHGKCTGRILGVDSVGAGKLEKLKIMYEKYQDINFSRSYFFTDNVSDEPLLAKVGNPFFLANGNRKNFNALKRLKNLKIIFPHTRNIQPYEPME